MNSTNHAPHLELDDLEWFITLGNLVGLRQSSWRQIRDRQDAVLTERIRQQALARIGNPELIQVTDDSFFVGTVDYVVHDTPRGIAYTVVETNGGSCRGLTLISPPDVEHLMAAFVEMLRFVDAGEPPLILIGHLDNDSLITERFLVACRLKQALEHTHPGLKARVLSWSQFHTLYQVGKEEAAIILSPYGQTATSLHVHDNQVYLLDRRVHAIIGDGVVRRHHQLAHRRADAVLANWIYPITDDKAATYEAVDQALDLLAPHGVSSLRFWRAWSREELEHLCEEKRSEVDGLLIKPFQGSGGVGVLPILSDSTVPEVVRDSLNEFHARYGRGFSPFPYTICEKIDSRKATWRGNHHNYDVSIYVARQGDMLIPAGCLIRLAPKPDRGVHSKETLIASLTGYGSVAAERGLGLCEECLQIVHLGEENMVEIFAASTLLMAAIARQPMDWPPPRSP